MDLKTVPNHQNSNSAQKGDRGPYLLRRDRFPALKSFQYPDYRWLWLGSFTSFGAVNMQQIARGWLILRLTDDSPLALSLVMMSFALPLMLASILGGALADRFSKKWMIIMSQGGNSVLTFLLAVLDLTGFIRFWHLIVIGMFNGVLFAFNMPSRQSIISDIVPEEDLMNAISLNSSGVNLTRIIGPALAGVLIIFIDTSGVFFLITLVYISSIFLTALIHEEKKSEQNMSKSVGTDIIEGFRYARGNSAVLSLLIMGFVPALFGFPYIALLPAWAREALNVQADGLGLLMMTMGIGSLVGTLILASIRHQKKRGAFLIGNGFFWGFMLILFSQTDSYMTAIPGLFFLGIANAVFMALNMSLVQYYASPEMRGRIVSMNLMTIGIMPLSAVPFGAMAERIGTPDALQIGGAFLTLFVLIFFLIYPKFRNID